MTLEEQLQHEHERNLRGIENAERRLRSMKPRIRLAMTSIHRGAKSFAFMITWQPNVTTMFYPSIKDAMRVVDIAASQNLKPEPAHEMATKGWTFANGAA